MITSLLGYRRISVDLSIWQCAGGHEGVNATRFQVKMFTSNIHKGREISISMMILMYRSNKVMVQSGSVVQDQK